MKLRVGKALSQGARILKENPVIFIPAAVIAILGSIFNYFTTNYYQIPEEPTELAELAGLLLSYQYFIIFIFYLLVLFLSCMIVRLAYDASRGEPSLFLSANIAVKKFIPVLIAIILWFLSIFTGLVLYFIPWIFFNVKLPRLWYIILFVIPGIFFAVKLYLWHYIILIEDEKIFSSMSRSWNIVKGNWWRVFWILAITSLIYLLSALIMDFIISAFLTKQAERIAGFLITFFGFPWVISTLVIAYKTLKAEPAEVESGLSNA